MDQSSKTLVDFLVVESNGKIIRSGVCDLDLLSMNADEGQFIFINPDPDTIQDDTHYYYNNGFYAIPDRPSEYHEFDYDQRRWVDTKQDQFSDISNKALMEINKITSNFRQAYITPIENQATVYQLKKEEAVSYLADPKPNLINYPMISAEVGITAATPDQVAQTYLNLNLLWMNLLASFEGIRLKAVEDILAASKADDVLDALNDFKIASAQFGSFFA